MKILYAAGPNTNAQIQLSRFLEAIADEPHLVKIAAFKKSSPKNVSVDWTLDCLLDIFNPRMPHSDNNNFSIFYDQVKSFAPDLVISDLEHFSSHVGNLLRIPVWQCSSSLINFAISPKQKMSINLRSRYSDLFNRYMTYHYWLVNIVNNADRNFVYSHFGDTPDPPNLNINFEWIRPYHQIGKKSILCQHNIVAGMLANNKKIFRILRKYPDSVAFTEFRHERHHNFILKDIGNQEEYFCNLANSRLFMCEGQTSFLADAFYNDKHPLIMINFDDLECVINGVHSEHLGLSDTIFDPMKSLEPHFDKSVDRSYDSRIRYLHERLGEA